MFVNFNYVCPQPVFYLGSALTSLSAVTVHLSKLQKDGTISSLQLLLIYKSQIKFINMSNIILFDYYIL